MHYHMPVYRPPSEADSLIFQATLGCSHNRCAFCTMYRSKKFRIRPWDDLKADILEMATGYRNARRIFLADGDALVLETEYMLRILHTLYEKFPSLERVSAYANPSNILEKSEEELQRINAAGLQLLYFGIETGDDELLVKIRKGANSEELIQSGTKAINAGFSLSATVILGLAGKKGSPRHAVETARVCSVINPQYLSALTLIFEGDGRYFFHCMEDEWELMDKIEVLQELRVMVDHFELKDCIFRSNHASNYLPIKATLNQEKSELLREIEDALRHPEALRPEFMRAL
ncbi:MAG: B12-binding domain-containing radical SAM protein [Deltaproteobacteria bacterium]|nr:B12-binding domain-containing radical SAM protein [Deltaproteobacteria bacterium]